MPASIICVMSHQFEVTVLRSKVEAELPEIIAFFERCPRSFAQQTPAWQNVIARLGQDECFFLTCSSRGEVVAVLPAYRFPGPLGPVLTSACQAGPLGGIACLEEESAKEIYGVLLDSYQQLASDTGCVLATVMMNPFWPDRGLYNSAFEPDYVLENVCQVLDLQHGVDSAGRFLDGTAHLQRNLRRLDPDQFLLDVKQDFANLDEWYEIHSERHRDIGAVPLPKALFAAALDEMIPLDKGRFFFVRRQDSGVMVAGGFYLWHGAVIDALMPSVSTRHARSGANYFLALESIRWARKRGLRYYNWQPSPPDGGVRRFKCQWGSRDASYYYLTKIIGDVRPILESTLSSVASAYPWHFVLPFDCMGPSPNETGRSSRRSSWNANVESRS